MPVLERFTKAEQKLLIALPYRVGLWVSESDTSGGDESDALELQAFEAMIAGYSEDFLKSEFVEELLNATLKARNEWSRWSEKLDSVTAECQQALGLLPQYISAGEIESFRQSLMEIAHTVAMAYREVEEEELTGFEKWKLQFRFQMARFQALLYKQPEPTMDQMLNISKEEKKALQELSMILKVDLNGNPLSSAQFA